MNKSLKLFAEEVGCFMAAHRGASGTEQENTLLAFQKAIEEGAEMIETDVRLSKDGIPYSYHDDEVQLNNKTIRLTELSFSEAQGIIDSVLPTLEDIVNTVRDKAYLMVEIKSDFSEASPSKGLEIARTVQTLGYLENTLFGSFDYRILALINHELPSANLACIKIPNQEVKLSELNSALNAKALICSIEELDTKLKAEADRLGIYIGAYGINSEEQLRIARGFGIKCIVTDYPAKIKRLMTLIQ
ncbi:MAG: glycerophosphodiester phosphodiesterase family protein [Candidatus Kapaibacteriales bacterium]